MCPESVPDNPDDDYLVKVVRKGDKGSKNLKDLTSETLRNCGYVNDIEFGGSQIHVLEIPANCYAVVYSGGGDPEKSDLSEYASSVVERLFNKGIGEGIVPLAFADVIDSVTGDFDDLETIADSLVSFANGHGLSIMNGENAILGPRVNPEIRANVTLTMIGMLDKDKVDENDIESLRRKGYCVFDPMGNPVYVNSDGVGTKTEFYERMVKRYPERRAEIYSRALLDFIAMNADDAVKIAAHVKCISGVCETRGDIPFDEIAANLKVFAEKLGFEGFLEHEDVGDRICGITDDSPSYNISGSTVSVVDRERLKNLPVPNAGEYVIAIRSKTPNPRSNGITSKREAMVKMLGPDWHMTPAGESYLEYLAAPSTVFYPVFSDLLDSGLATFVTHMSGGALRGKFGRELKKHDLYVKFTNMFYPDEREIKIAGVAGLEAEVAFEKYPMGTDAYVATKKPAEAIKYLESLGFEAKEVGILQSKNECGNTGVEFIAPHYGTRVFYSG